MGYYEKCAPSRFIYVFTLQLFYNSSMFWRLPTKPDLSSWQRVMLDSHFSGLRPQEDTRGRVNKACSGEIKVDKKVREELQKTEDFYINPELMGGDRAFT